MHSMRVPYACTVPHMRISESTLVTLRTLVAPHALPHSIPAPLPNQPDYYPYRVRRKLQTDLLRGSIHPLKIQIQVQ